MCHGHAFVDGALSLPKAWTGGRERLEAAHVPPEIDFAARPALALAMIRRAMEADVPFAWVAADSVYGVGDIEMALRQVGKGYVLGVNTNSQFHSWIGKPSVARTAAEIAKNELGLDHNESRSWHGWHRHVSLVILAFAVLADIRKKANGARHVKRGSPPRP